MGLKCKISYSNGVARVTDDAGNPSRLYEQILSTVQDQDTALNVWATAYSKDFGEKGEDASVTELVKYFDSKLATESSLSASEMYQVKDFMKRFGISSLSELNTMMSQIFKPNGIFDIDVKKAVELGVYSQEELKTINTKQLQNILHKIEGHLLIEDIKVDPENQQYEHKNSERRTIFGTYERVSNKELDNAIVNSVDSFTDVESFYNSIKDLPYPDFIYDFVNDDEFANQVMNRFKDLKKIPRLSVVGGELSAENNEVYTTVKNTILSNINNIELESEIRYLDSIPQDIWEENQEDIKQVLKEVEDVLVSLNLDVIGIADNSENRQEVMMLLQAANNLIRNVNEQTLQTFANVHKATFPRSQRVITEAIPEKYTGYNIVSLYSGDSQTNLFNKFGLIKVGENLYHKVDQSADINDVRDYIYSELREDRIKIPSEYLITKDLGNKPEALEDISRYLMSREVPQGLDNQELYSGYQVAFGHSAIEPDISQTKGLIRIKTDEQYLKTSFVSDFYNYILREKLKDSQVYKDTLSKFEINDKDISMLDLVESINDIEYSQELKDYITLKRDSNMNYLVDNSKAMVSEDMLVLNYPETVKEYEGDLVLVGDYIVAPNTTDNYLKLNGELYRKGLEGDNSDLFVKVVTPKNNVYFTSNTDFSFDRSRGKGILDNFRGLKDRTQSFTDFKNTISRSRITDDLRSDLRQFSTLKDKSYTFFEVNDSIVAYKDGVRVGAIRPDAVPDGYSDPKLSVSETHRGKGIGTELYLRMFEKVAKEGKVFYPSEVRTKQAENIFFRLEELLEQTDSGGFKVKDSRKETRIEIVEDIATNFDSKLTLLDTYSPKEEVEILNRIQDCA